MYFLSWCTSCTNSLDTFFVYLIYVLAILFCTVFGVVLAKLIFDKFVEPKKLKYSSVVFGVMCILIGFGIGILIIPLINYLSDFIADKLYGSPVVNGNKLPSSEDIIKLNGNYVMSFLLTIPLVSYLYFLVVNLINEKRKKNKKINKYVVIGVFVACLVVFGLLFGFLHEPVVDALEKFYTCSNVC